MDTDSRIFVAGHNGMIGSAVARRLSQEGYHAIVTRDKSRLDLTDSEAVKRFFDEEKPHYVVLAAGRTGGIQANQAIPVDFLHINLMISLNMLSAARNNGVKKLIFLCSSCMYPSHCPQPMHEDQLLTGKPDISAMPMAVSKLAGLQLCHAYNHQYGGARYIPIIPNSAYGPGDDFNPASGHVLSALIRRFHDAKLAGNKTVELWGSGNPRREFIHVDDIARACIALLKAPIEANALPVNIGVGEDYSIRELAEIVAGIVGYAGAVTWNTEKPDGPPRKLLDSSRMRKLGWSPVIALEAGIRDTYRWYLDNLAG